ncbi:MAG: MBL fold metallo-hydrolase, partial [Deltaproteobacteria bacterium]|nr:MBL fold metallo-hydrolase [Deltaproteobacteria bacterium]
PLKASVWVVDLFSKVPYSSVWVTTPAILEIALFYGLVMCILEFKRYRVARYAFAIALITFIIDYGYWYHRLYHNPNLKVTFISIGQGDSSLVEFPGGKRMLIDGGGFHSDDFDVGEKVIAPFLWKNKIKRVDYLVLSHPQADHLKGLTFIARNFGVKEFWWNGDKGGEEFVELMDVVNKKGIKKAVINATTLSLEIKGAKLEFLHPPEGSHPLSVNDRSLVIKITYGKVRLLFPGDIQKNGEALLLNSNKDLKATVLKVPHHGSRTSSTAGFTDRVSPEVVVISVGYDNPFRFPHPEVVEGYKGAGSLIYRTDVDGAVTVETDGLGLRVERYAISPSSGG